MATIDHQAAFIEPGLARLEHVWQSTDAAVHCTRELIERIGLDVAAVATSAADAPHRLHSGGISTPKQIATLIDRICDDRHAARTDFAEVLHAQARTVFGRLDSGRSAPPRAALNEDPQRSGPPVPGVAGTGHPHAQGYLAGRQPDAAI